MNKFALIDFSEVLYRYFYAYRDLRDQDGVAVGCSFGVSSLCFNFFRGYYDPYKGFKRIIFVMDSQNNWRKKIYSQYKANRVEPPVEMLSQIPIVQDIIYQFGFEIIQHDGYEADDVIASLQDKIKKENNHNHVTIFSSDKDIYQLIDSRTIAYSFRKKSHITHEEVFKKYGVYPSQMVLFQSLTGDSSDNIPGIRGVGPKNALKIMSQYSTKEELIENISSIKPVRIRTEFEKQKNEIETFMLLVTLKKEIPVNIHVEQRIINKEKLYSIFDKIGFGTFIDQLDKI